MFDFGNANEAQRAAISTVEGPVLITAGPGTGKTYTLVQRAIYLIEECGVQPEHILITTFTEKSAKELITRISSELSSRGVSANIHEMYIGTFHSICLRILKDYKEFTRIRGNYRILDSFDQQYMVFRNAHKLKNIPGIRDVLSQEIGAWEKSRAICYYVNNLSEELVSPEELISSRDPRVKALGLLLKEYKKLLDEENSMDFPSIQTETYHLLSNNHDVLKELRSRISHIVCQQFLIRRRRRMMEFVDDDIIIKIGRRFICERLRIERLDRHEQMIDALWPVIADKQLAEVRILQNCPEGAKALLQDLFPMCHKQQTARLPGILLAEMLIIQC